MLSWSVSQVSINPIASKEIYVVSKYNYNLSKLFLRLRVLTAKVENVDFCLSLDDN